MSQGSDIGLALTELNALVKLRDTDGWKIICSKYSDRFRDLTYAVLDATTPASEAEILRQARGRIERDFAPETILSDLIAKREAEAARKLSSQKSNDNSALTK